MTPTRQSVSVAIFTPDRSRVLIVQRPSDDDELPNAWGLPAASLTSDEDVHAAILRIGTQKLGVALRPLGELQRGDVQRAGYRLQMRLVEAEILDGVVAVPQPDATVTQYQAWRWGSSEDLRPAAQRGSLCCQLFLAG